MRNQGRGALIRMGGAPLVESWSLLFIRPPPPLSHHPSVKIGGGGALMVYYGNYSLVVPCSLYTSSLYDDVIAVAVNQHFVFM